MGWDEGELSMTQFRGVAEDALGSATLAYGRLMYEWQPDCALATMRDRLSNTDRGYSFVSEPANGLSEAYLALSERACLARLDGLLSRDGGWDRRAVHRYLALCDEALQRLMLAIYLTGGQAACSTKLLSI